MDILSTMDSFQEQFFPSPSLPSITINSNLIRFDNKIVKDVYHQAHKAWMQMKERTPEENRWSEYVYCLESYLVEGSKDTYEVAARFAKEYGFDSVVDIGCACGAQGNLFSQVGIQYLGVEVCKMKMFPETEGVSYLFAKYPCQLPETKSNVLGVSNLCVGYLCCEYESIAKQFDNFLLCSCREAYDALGAYYETARTVIDPTGKVENRWVWYSKSKLR